MAKKAYLKQAAEELGFTPYQLRRMAKEGSVPFIMSGNRYIFDIELVDTHLKKEALKHVKQEESIKEYGVLRKINAD